MECREVNLSEVNLKTIKKPTDENINERKLFLKEKEAKIQTPQHHNILKCHR